MNIDKKPLILLGIAVFALFIMGVVLAFKSQFRDLMEQPNNHQTRAASTVSFELSYQ